LPELLQRAYGAGANAATPTIRKQDGIYLKLETRPQRQRLADLSNAEHGAFTPARGALTPFVAALLGHFTQVPGMRPAVITVRVSADPPPFTILVGDRRSLAQHELGHLLCSDSWLDENWSDCCAGYCCGHHDLAVTGSSRVLFWMRIPGRVSLPGTCRSGR
jgi:hypothetical protein